VLKDSHCKAGAEGEMDSGLVSIERVGGLSVLAFMLIKKPLTSVSVRKAMRLYIHE